MNLCMSAKVRKLFNQSVCLCKFNDYSKKCPCVLLADKRES